MPEAGSLSLTFAAVHPCLVQQHICQKAAVQEHTFLWYLEFEWVQEVRAAQMQLAWCPLALI